MPADEAPQRPEGRAAPLLLDAAGQQTPVLKWYHWGILISVGVLGPFSQDSYVPNMPEMASELHTSAFYAGLTLQVNLMTKGIFNLVLGQLSDNLGRRPVIIASFFAYIAGTICCSIAPTIGWLLAGRVLQGVGEANAAITQAIPRDVIDDERERMQMTALLGTVRPLAIITAPSIGGLLGAVFGWRNVFRCLAGWGVLNLVLAAMLLPETLPATPARGDGGAAVPDSDASVMSQVRRLICNRVTGGLLVTATFVRSGPSSMLSNISFVLEKEFGLSVVLCSLLIGSIPLLIILANVWILAAAKKMDPWRMLRISIIIQSCVGCAAFLMMTIASKTLWADMLVFYAMVLDNSLISAPMNTLYLQPVKDIAGLASGVQAFATSIFPSAAAAAATFATDQVGAAGLMASLGVILLGCSISFWGTFGIRPRASEVSPAEPRAPQAAAELAPAAAARGGP